METTRGPRSRIAPAAPVTTPAMSCGLTASTTTSLAEAASSLSDVTPTANRSARSWRFSATGSATTMRAGG